MHRALPFTSGRRYLLSPPHFKYVILRVVVYKQVQVRSSTRCCKDKGLYVGFLVLKPAGTTNISFGFSVLTSPGVYNSSLERPCQFDVERWPGRTDLAHCGKLKDLTFPSLKSCTSINTWVYWGHCDRQSFIQKLFLSLCHVLPPLFFF